MSVQRQPMSDRPSLTPVWLDHLAALGWRVLVTVALAGVAVWLALVLSTVTASVLIAVIVAATFAPLATALRDRGWSRTKTAAVVTLGAILVITAVVVLILLAFAPYVPQVVSAIQAGVAKAQADLTAAGVTSDQIAGFEQQVQTWLTAEVSAIAGTIGSLVTIAILGGILLFFLLQDGDKAWVWSLQAMGDWQKERISTSGDDALQRVGGYLRGTAVLAAAHALTDFAYLFILGVPLPAPLAVLVFFGGFIPYVGGLVATLIVLAAAYSSIGAQGTFVLLVLIVITNLILNNLVRPIVYGKTVHIHPAVVLVALPAGAAVAGIVGLFVAIPVVAFVTAVWGSVVAILEPERDPVAEDIGIVPGWLDRVAQWSWRLLVGAALLAFAIWVAVMLPLVVMPIILAVVLAATFSPLVSRLLSRGWGRGRAALTVTAGAFLIITGIMVLTSVVLVEQLQPIVAQSTAGASAIDAATGGALDSLTSTTAEATGTVVSAASSFASGIAGLAIVLVLATLLTFYFLRDGSTAWGTGIGRLAVWRRAEVDAAGRRAAGVLGGYMIGTGAISLFAAVTQWVIMVILGLPLALPLAVLAFFLGFIPYIGSIVATGLAFLVAIAVGTTQDVAIMALYTVVFNIVQGNVVAPLVYGKAVNLHPAIVLMAIPAGAALAGVIGMFLAVPFIGVIAATWRTVLRLFGDRPGEETPSPVPVDDPGSAPANGADIPAPS